MKSKFGGLNNYLNSSITTPRGTRKPALERVESDRELSNSRYAPDQKPKKRYDDVDYEEDRHARRRQLDVDNEEDLRTSKVSHRSRHEPEPIKRTNSRDMLGTLNQPSRNSDRNREDRSNKYLKSEQAEPARTHRSRAGAQKNMTESEYANFQHVHQETKHCVELLLKKTGNSIHNLNETINEFKQNLRRIVENEYTKLQTVIMNAVESIFNSELENIRKLCKVEEKKTAKNINETREELDHIYGNLQKIKEGIDGPNWKRYAGDFFKDDIETQVESLVRRSEKLQVNRTVHMNYDPRREQDFRVALQKLLQVNLTTTLESENR